MIGLTLRTAAAGAALVGLLAASGLLRGARP